MSSVGRFFQRHGTCRRMSWAYADPVPVMYLLTYSGRMYRIVSNSQSSQGFHGVCARGNINAWRLHSDSMSPHWRV